MDGTVSPPPSLTSSGFPSVAATQELSFLRKSSEKRLLAKLVWTSTKGIVGPLFLLVLEQRLQEKCSVGGSFRYSQLPACVTSKYTYLSPNQWNLAHKKASRQHFRIRSVWCFFFFFFSNNCVTSGNEELLSFSLSLFWCDSIFRKFILKKVTGC